MRGDNITAFAKGVSIADGGGGRRSIRERVKGAAGQHGTKRPSLPLPTQLPATLVSNKRGLSLSVKLIPFTDIITFIIHNAD